MAGHTETHASRTVADERQLTLDGVETLVVAGRLVTARVGWAAGDDASRMRRRRQAAVECCSVTVAGRRRTQLVARRAGRSERRQPVMLGRRRAHAG